MNFLLRPWKMSDLDNLVKVANNFNIAKFMNDQFLHPYTIECGRTFIESIQNDVPVKIFAIDIFGIAVGGIGLHPQEYIYRKNAELGYWLAEEYWGQGIMTNAIIQIVQYGFEAFDLHRIYARPFGTNVASQKVLQKAGFILEARINNSIFKNNEFHDELIYAIRK